MSRTWVVSLPGMRWFLPFEVGGDLAGGLVGGDVDVVVELLAEGGEVEGDAVLVGEGEVDLVDGRFGGEGGVGHLVQRFLNGEALVSREGGEQRGADAREGGVELGYRLLLERPVGRHFGGENAVGGLGERRELVADK